MLKELREYEGGRGIAYLMAIFGSVAPPLVALYLIAPQQFLAMDPTKLLLLGASCGGFVLTLSVISGALNSIADEPGAEREKGMKAAMLFGAAMALLTQGGVLAAALSWKWSFSAFVRGSIGIAAAYTATSLVMAVFATTLHDRRKKKLPARELPDELQD
jgi:MFS family permease